MKNRKFVWLIAEWYWQLGTDKQAVDYDKENSGKHNSNCSHMKLMKANDSEESADGY